MALVFGLAELKSRLIGWRWDRRGTVQRTSRSYSAPMTPHALSFGGDPDISRMIEHQVIPLLVHACYDPVEDHSPISSVPLPGDTDDGAQPDLHPDVEPFATLAMEADTPALMAFVDHRLEAGHSVETLFVELMAPAARLLGEYWEDDSRDFLDVTMGLWRIQQTLREVAERSAPPMRTGHGRHAILLSAVPGDQHAFGAQMVAECFAREGWATDLLVQPTGSELNEKLADIHYDVLGLTVSCDCSTAALRSLVTAARSVSRNPEIRILIGGRVVNDHPGLVQACGADGTAIDALSAVDLAARLVPTIRERPDDLT